MSISFEGIGQVLATFAVEPDAELAAGQAVTLVDEATVGLGAAGNQMCGVVADNQRCGMAAVQVEGFVTVGYAGTAPTVGFSGLSVAGDGTVQVDENGFTYLVAAVDTDSLSAVIKL